MRILGVSCYFHDAAAALLSDGQLVAAAEEERFSRIKHDPSFPQRAIEFCLNSAGLEGKDLDYVVFFEKPFLKFERLLVSCLQGFPRSRRLFQEAMISWLGDKLWIKDLLARRLGLPHSRVLFSRHHLSHAASAFFCSPYEEAAILTIDGVGEWATAAIGVGRSTDIRLLEEIRFPHSLGLLYSAFTAFLGFEVNEGEYKVMGMAPYGEPKYLDEVCRLIRVNADGSFELNLDYFSFQHSAEATFNTRFEHLFGNPRNPAQRFDPREKESRRYADVAASIQAVTEDIVVRMAAHAQRLTGMRRLCLAGGVALNSAANGRLLREGLFDEIYIQPAAGDSGGALGAALYAHHMVLGQPRAFVMEHAAWGEEHSPGTLRKFLDESGLRYRCFPDEDLLIQEVAGQLARGLVIGWCQGRFEWGPRALGNRSILADPRGAQMKDTVNQKIKFREEFRPFAPAVSLPRAPEYFDLIGPERQYPARFMLYVVPVRAEKRDAIPAVTHVDGTARVQVVSESGSLYSRLIGAFGEATGTPVLLNTSFNLKGEPIVNTPEEACASWKRSGMDTLVLGPFLVEKRDQSG